jgi:hypothetical protein
MVLLSKSYVSKCLAFTCNVIIVSSAGTISTLAGERIRRPLGKIFKLNLRSSVSRHLVVCSSFEPITRSADDSRLSTDRRTYFLLCTTRSFLFLFVFMSATVHLHRVDASTHRWMTNFCYLQMDNKDDPSESDSLWPFSGTSSSSLADIFDTAFTSSVDRQPAPGEAFSLASFS